MSMLNVREQGTQGVFVSEDTRFKIIGRLPVQEVEARVSKKIGPIATWLLDNRFKPLNMFSEKAMITMTARIATNDSSKDFWCYSCQCYHSRYLPEEVALVITDSMGNMFKNSKSKVRDECHTDQLYRPGSSLDELSATTAYFYMHCESPIKAVVCAGYNDYLKNRSRSEKTGG